MRYDNYTEDLKSHHSLGPNFVTDPILVNSTFSRVKKISPCVSVRLVENKSLCFSAARRK